MISRVSDGQTFARVSLNLARLQTRLQDISEEVGSGTSLNRLSDDPAGAGAVVRSSSVLNSLTQDRRSASFARGFLSAQDGVLNDVGNIITRAREVAVQQANGVVTDSDRALAAVEVHSLLVALVGMANADLAGRRLFSSGEDVVVGSEPFTDPDDAAFDPANPYNGSTSQQLEVEVGAGELIRVTTDGSQVFGTAIAALDDLETRLTAATDPSVSLNSLEQAATDISTERSSIGTRVRRIDQQMGQIDRSELVNMEFINSSFGTDLVEKVANLVQMQSHLQVAAAASQRVIEASLAGLLSI